MELTQMPLSFLRVKGLIKFSTKSILVWGLVMDLRKKILILSLLAAIIMGGFIWRITNSEETILETDVYFRITEAEEGEYRYKIYNTDGKEIKNGVSYFTEPLIHYIDQETIEICIGVGTDTFYCVYYDIVNDRFSEQYESPVAAKYHRVAFLRYEGGERFLVIKDMFDEENCYEEFALDFTKAISPIVNAVFIDGDTLFITYRTENFYEEKTKSLCWGNSDKEDKVIEETIIKNDPYFRIIEVGEGEYLYKIYNTDGVEIKSDISYRIEPWIHYIDQDTIEIHISVGIGTFYCVYYDIVNDRFSEQYESPVAAKYHRVALLDNEDGERSVVIKDMFDEGNCYQKYFLDFAEVLSPVISAVFIDEDTLLITYNSDESNNYKKKKKLLYWG